MTDKTKAHHGYEGCEITYGTAGVGEYVVPADAAAAKKQLDYWIAKDKAAEEAAAKAAEEEEGAMVKLSAAAAILGAVMIQ